MDVFKLQKNLGLPFVPAGLFRLLVTMKAAGYRTSVGYCPRIILLRPCLCLNEIEIVAMLGHQLIVSPCFSNLTFTNDANQICILNGRQPMGDDYNGLFSPFQQVIQRVLNDGFRFAVQSRGGLVQQKDLGLLD